MYSKKILLLVVLFFSAVVCSQSKLSTGVIVIENIAKKKINMTVEFADNNESRTYGLMNRDSLDPDSGMLFLFSREQYLNFWMKNTRMPLSIAYINSKGIIMDIQDMEPMNEDITYPSKYPAKYALEVNRGFFARNNIAVGCYVKIVSGR